MPAVIQVVSIDYGKAGRGGEGARRRAQLPTTWPVPDGEADVLHEVRMTEWSGYRRRVTTKDLGEKLAGPDGVMVADAVRIRTEDGAVIATVEATGARLVVASGWGQLRTNRRIVTFEESWYREVIVNVARVAGRITGQVFAGAPTVARDARGAIERRRKRAV